jgi:GTPase
MVEAEYRSGYIGIMGKPNVGKSTLMNRLLQYKLAITSPRPQTTRNRILGIKTLPNVQMVFVDTPGIHEAQGPFHRFMVREALKNVKDVDLIIMIVDAARAPGKDERYLLENLRTAEAGVLLVINKIDCVSKEQLLPLIEGYKDLHTFQAMVPISALTGDGVELLEREIVERLPLGPQYFPEDQITDLPERFLAAEVIREKVFLKCGEEIPYSVAVVVEEFQERKPPRPVYISANLYVEKDSQKGIVIGAGGRMLKRIGKAAREDLQVLLGRSVYLELTVKVEKNWSKDEKALRRLGYR